MTLAEFPARIAERYRPIREIGKGGMGVVYEVEHEHTGERLALKLVLGRANASNDTVDRFKREARVSARIKSDHVVRVTDAGVAADFGDVPFLVMELLEGTDLERVTGGEPQSPDLVVTWLRQVARALDRAHQLGIVHRDLKPEHLFLTQREDGTPLVKILDFGIVKMLADQGSTTGGGQLLGTPLYMAPEQIHEDQGGVTGATDRYALGLVAYKLLTGRHYREGETLVQVVAQLMKRRVIPPSSRGCTAGPGFDRWFKRACHPDAEARFPTAADQIEELASVLGLPTQSIESSGDIAFEPGLDSGPTVEIEGHFGDSQSRRAWWIAALVGAATVIAFVSALVVGRSNRPAAEDSSAIAASGTSISKPVPSAAGDAASSTPAVATSGQAAASTASASSVASANATPPRVPIPATVPKPVRTHAAPSNETDTPSDPAGRNPNEDAPFGSGPLAEQK